MEPDRYRRTLFETGRPGLLFAQLGPRRLPLRLGGYPLEQWGLLLLVTVTAQLLGHSVFNHLLATTSPMVVSIALLLEVPGAALIAAGLLGQQPPLAALAGLAVMLTGLVLVVVGNRGRAVEPLVEAPVD